MIESKRRSHLPALGHSRPNAMTFITTQFLGPAVFRVTESDFESCRLRRRSRIATELMTRAAGGDVPVAGLRLRAVALVARDMRVEARGNRHRHPGATRSMTGRTTRAAHAGVTRMVELHIETSERRKRFQCS